MSSYYHACLRGLLVVARSVALGGSNEVERVHWGGQRVQGQSYCCVVILALRMLT